MEPDYSRLDPEERTNKWMALFSVAFGLFGMCGGLIPAVGIILGLLGIVTGIFGRRSESKKLAFVGIVLSSLVMLVSFVYAIFIYIGTK